MCVSERILGYAAYTVVSHGCRIDTTRQIVTFALALGFHLHLHLVKSASVNSVDIALRDKGITVYRFNDAEDCDRLDFAATMSIFTGVLLYQPIASTTVHPR